mgnify:CR=1 FL=1
MPKAQRPLPTCRDFLIAAVRFLRPKRKHVHAVRLAVAYHAALELYDEVDIRVALNEALKDGTLVVTGRFIETKEGKNVTDELRMQKILKEYPIGERSWRLTPEGKPANRETDPHHIFTHRVMLYVAQDGLPKRLQKVGSSPSAQVSQQILASIGRKRPRQK